MHLSKVHIHHFLAGFNYLYTVYILKLLSTAFQPLNVVVIFFSDTPDIIPKFDTIFRIRNSSVTLFLSVQSFVHLFLVDLK